MAILAVSFIFNFSKKMFQHIIFILSFFFCSITTLLISVLPPLKESPPSLTTLCLQSILSKHNNLFSELLKNSSTNLLTDILDEFQEEPFPEFNARYCIKQSDNNHLVGCLMALSPDNRYFVSASLYDGLIIKIWNLQTKKIINCLNFEEKLQHHFPYYNARISALTITPDSKFLLIALNCGYLYCYNLEEHSFYCQSLNCYDNIHKIVITDDLNWAILCAKNGNSHSIAILSLHEWERSHPIHNLQGVTSYHTFMHGIFLGVSHNYCLIFDKVMKRIAIRKLDDKNTHEPPLFTPILDASIPVTMSQIDFCFIEQNDNKIYLVAGSLYDGIFRWNLKTQELIFQKTHPANHNLLTFNKQYCVYHNAHHSISIWSLKKDTEILNIPTNLSFNNIFITHDHKYIIAIESFSIHIFSFKSGKLLNEIFLDKNEIPINIISSQSNNIIVFACLNGDFLFLDLEDNLRTDLLSIHQKYFLLYMHYNRTLSYEQLTANEQELFHSLPYKFQKIIIESRGKEVRELKDYEQNKECLIL